MVTPQVAPLQSWLAVVTVDYDGNLSSDHLSCHGEFMTVSVAIRLCHSAGTGHVNANRLLVGCTLWTAFLQVGDSAVLAVMQEGMKLSCHHQQMSHRRKTEMLRQKLS